MKQKLIMLIGLSGSGKSTVSKQYKNNGYIIHSSDEIRKTVFHDETYQLNNKKVFSILDNRVKNDINKGMSVVYDATNLSEDRRISYINQIKEIFPNLQIICHYMNTPLEICIQRDSKRERVVGEEIIKMQNNKFQLPKIIEGWDEIIIDNYCKINTTL